jgi:hypothetical protein
MKRKTFSVTFKLTDFQLKDNVNGHHQLHPDSAFNLISAVEQAWSLQVLGPVPP